MSVPIIPWQGGKRRLAPHILPLLETPHKTYVEPFAGGAAIFFLKQPSKVEVLNDINGELINLYMVVRHHLEEFVRHFKWCLTSRQIFELEKNKKPGTLTDIQRACRFFYLQKLTYGANVQNRCFGNDKNFPKRFNILRIEEDLSMAHLRLSATVIEHLPWQECVERYDGPETIFYLDPPYLDTAGYGGSFEFNNYEDISDYARNIKGKMIISHNKNETIEKLFHGLLVEKVPIKYTMGGGDKIADDVELIFRNFENENLLI